MRERVWQEGPPPHVGWWNASWNKGEWIWRWWDGKVWSMPSLRHFPIKNVVHNAMCPDNPKVNILWTDYYPKDARVLRVNPNKGIS